MTAKEISDATNGIWSEEAVRAKLGINQKPVPGEDDGTQEELMAIQNEIEDGMQVVTGGVISEIKKMFTKMYEEGYIDEITYEETLNIPLDSYLSKGEINENIGIYSSYIDYAITEASNYEIDLNTKDTKITINVDSDIQSYIYQIINNKFNNLINTQYYMC